MKEYLAYIAVTAEKIDLKKTTETEAEYEMARKEASWKSANIWPTWQFWAKGRQEEAN